MNRILVAARGEIARRIIRTCTMLGYETLAIYDEKDTGALHTREATMAKKLLGGSLAETYLNGQAIVNLAVKNDCHGIHPGYGFLSENSAFASLVVENGLLWIGPRSDTIELMGDKGLAKDFMIAHDIPVIPGYQGLDQSDTKLTEMAEKIGFPLMIKAAHGGGGRGIRIISSRGDLKEGLAAARREAKASFNSETLILEKQVVSARHIEVQILGDNFGRVLVLFERECSIQRRNQKIIEEAPAHFLHENIRKKLWDLAQKIGTLAKYVSAGTVEFLVDAEENIYFLEMNTRIQVEHPVTEELTGIDIVAQQLDIAASKPITLTQNDIKASGHVIEVRLYSEDPFRGFMPQTGRIEKLVWPTKPGLRIDHDLEVGKVIRSDLDPMIAKIIVKGQDRPSAIRLLKATLSESCVMGVKHNEEYLHSLISTPWFFSGDFNTKTIDQLPECKSKLPMNQAMAACALSLEIPGLMARKSFAYLRNSLPTFSPFHFQMDEVYQGSLEVLQPGKGCFKFHFTDQSRTLILKQFTEDYFVFEDEGQTIKTFYYSENQNFWLKINDSLLTFKNLLYEPPQKTGESMSGLLKAPMDGAITKIMTKFDSNVAFGETLIILEAMKMEHEIKAPFAGRVSNVHVISGQQVALNQLILEIDAKGL